jgi:chemotaxis protein CheX
MKTVVGIPNGITMRDLETGLEKALQEITTTMFDCCSRIVPLDPSEAISPGLSAIVGFGGKISGFIAIHLPFQSACMLAGQLLGMKFETVDEIVADAMGEMVNMIAGGLKKFAGRDEDLFKISIPSIVYGTDYSTHASKDAETLILGVETAGCCFNLQLVFAYR